MELQFLGQWFGVLIAVVSSSLGGAAAAVTRYLVGNADPITLAILRWGIGLAKPQTQARNVGKCAALPI